MSDRIARAFIRSGAIRIVALDISKAFDKVWHTGVLEKLVNNRILDYLEKFGLFLISSMVLGFLNQLQILLVVSDTITRVFNRSGDT